MITPTLRIEQYAERRRKIAADPSLHGIDGAEVKRPTEASDALTIRLRLIPHVGFTGAALQLAAESVLLEGKGAGAWAVEPGGVQLVEPSIVSVVVSRKRGVRVAPGAPVTVRIAQPEFVWPFDSVDVVLDPPAASGDVVTASDAPAVQPLCDVPVIDYLAKDYAAFRRLMLDRMAVTDPQWSETHAADVGVMLVEVLAYAADYLSYYQDAVGTESYLDTARLRTSVRRHARALGFRMNEGCAPRVWLQFEVLADVTIPQGFPVGAGAVPVAAGRLAPGAVVRGEYVYTTLAAEQCRVSNNSFLVYDWGKDEATLEANAICATLVLGDQPGTIVPGDVLVLEQTVDPQTGLREDADPALRHAVRILVADPPFVDLGTPVVTVYWGTGDALPFEIVIAARSSIDGSRRSSLATAYGNVVPAEYGAPVVSARSDERRDPSRFVEGEWLPDVPRPGRQYHPALKRRNLTYTVPYQPAPDQPAATFLQPAPDSAVPAIVLDEYPFGEQGVTPLRWVAVPDLLEVGPNARAFVVESENDGSVALRFGDGIHGRVPLAGAWFKARYRVGNGPSGDVGADTLTNQMTSSYPYLEDPPYDWTLEEAALIASVRNPLPSAGGAEPMALDTVRIEAPQRIREQRRCVVTDDYAVAALELPQVRSAAADVRFTGSWRTVRVFVQSAADDGETAGFLRTVREYIGAQRLIGADFVVVPPFYAEIDAAITVRLRRGVQDEAVRIAVDAAVAEFLGAHPTFALGETVYASPLVETVMHVPGVRDVRVTRFARRGAHVPPGAETVSIAFGPHEAARFTRCAIAYATAGGRA